MQANRVTSQKAQRYLRELKSTLAEVPASVRSDLLADVEAELEGLDDEQAAIRIAELGDPLKIATDAAEVAGRSSGQSRTYPLVTVLLLIFGGYLVPVVGWLLGLVLIGRSSSWTAQLRRRAIIASIAGVLASLLVLGAMHVFNRGSQLVIPGLAVIVLLPFVVNVIVGRQLTRGWTPGVI